MSRTREWIKFGTLIGVTLALAVVFMSLIDAPTRSLAQQPAIQSTASRPAPVQASQPVIDLGNAFVSVAEVVRPAVVYIQSQQRVEARAPQQEHPELPAPSTGSSSIRVETPRSSHSAAAAADSSSLPTDTS
ncbi:MAG: hypothetical protein OEO20_03985 [Gemmatimonadota bacterium]|nr:hypothetical protein [Gemmatimonadota bacterium]